MKVHCKHCGRSFEVASADAGKVQYSKHNSVFRVELHLKSPCPNCDTMLKVIKNEKRELIGYPVDPILAKKTEKSIKDAPLEKTRIKPAPRSSKNHIQQKISVSPAALKRSAELEKHIRQQLQKRSDSISRYSVQGLKKRPKPKNNKVIIPNVEKMADHIWQPRIYLSILTLLCLSLVFGIMNSVFKPKSSENFISQNDSSIEGELEEFEPAHGHEDAVGGPSYPSETDRKTGLEDETIKKINSNLQILHLPPLNQVTSTFGVRLDPFTKKLAFHAGVDFKATTKTRIEAAMDGVVKHAGPRNMYGNAVIITHANGYETLYGHLSRILVKVGQKISQKDVIAFAGSTGRSTGTHLHFELIKNGKKIDPLSTELLHFTLGAGKKVTVKTTIHPQKKIAKKK